jgi:hypothetical protein
MDKALAFPSLIDATIDDIKAALESKLFTSVDLVNVGFTGGEMELKGWEIV